MDAYLVNTTQKTAPNRLGAVRMALEFGYASRLALRRSTIATQAAQANPILTPRSMRL